jgi:DNA-binding LacI/PurR family transcriptional regulator
MPRITLSNVAKEAGVSKTTASLVLSGKADHLNIAKSTQNKVLETAAILKYKPSKFNPARLNGHTGILLVLSTEFSSYEKSLWIESLIRKGWQSGYLIIPQLTQANTCLEVVSQIPADGLIFIDPNSLPDDRAFLRNDPTPIVCGGFTIEENKGTDIAYELEKEINYLITKLYQRNKKAIGFLGGSTSSPDQNRIMNTYKENYCKRFEIEERIALIDNENQINEACHRLMEDGANGIIIENPELAEKALKSEAVRNQNNNGVVFACMGLTNINQYMREGTLITSNRNIEKLAEEVIFEIIK